jgi:NAD(P)-dependent dehydrogenase (short-subunit alcohol dehydrogenase family)
MMNDVFSLKGRTALVTGGTRGIGRMIAQGFLEQGAKVYISGRSSERAEAAARELSAFGPCIPLAIDAAGFLTQRLHDALKAEATADRLSKVIVIASVDGFFVNRAESYSYHASKAGVLHLAKKMAMHLIKDHIVVSAIAPGAFPTDMNRVARDTPEFYDSHIPAKRIGRPEDIAGAAVFLASRAGDYVVGTAVVVDGGVSWGY